MCMSNKHASQDSCTDHPWNKLFKWYMVYFCLGAQRNFDVAYLYHGR
jgi:hypothetical protein